MLSGLYTALSGMNAHRQILDVTSHNVANQATPGYHRQMVDLRAGGLGASGIFAGSKYLPGGVDAVAVRRVLDTLAENRLVRETALDAGAMTLAINLGRLEMAFTEPSNDGMAALLDDFWGGWSDLATVPGDTAMRSQLLERSQSVIDSLRRASADLDAVALGAQQEIHALAADVNEIAARIAQMNGAIAGSPTTPNDLLDQRDALVRELSALTGAVARPGQGGQVEVSIGGRSIVYGANSQRVSGLGGTLTWEADGTAVLAPEGKAAALRTIIADVVPRYRTKLDAVAAALVNTVNGVHTTGYDLGGTTGRNFFDPAGVTAATISLSADVAGQPGNIAAGAPVFPGPTAPGPLDGELARAIALLADAATGPDSAYRSLVADLGVEVRAARQRSEVQGQVTAAAQQVADSVGGVSIDEEMVSMLAAQRGYEASARVLTTVDQLLETLISRTGVVGR
ncbi:MAG TPA: flagellar hook-associated protein FlgK [Ilumatobacter sp.]|nr:flagellar hook-associated protein FlgK [Ilumatobacter sp.]